MLGMKAPELHRCPIHFKEYQCHIRSQGCLWWGNRQDKTVHQILESISDKIYKCFRLTRHVWSTKVAQRPIVSPSERADRAALWKPRLSLRVLPGGMRGDGLPVTSRQETFEWTTKLMLQEVQHEPKGNMARSLWSLIGSLQSHSQTLKKEIFFYLQFPLFWMFQVPEHGRRCN